MEGVGKGHFSTVKSDDIDDDDDDSKDNGSNVLQSDFDMIIRKISIRDSIFAKQS